MSETVYIETSILGYLTVRPSRDLVVAANVEVTREWWDTRRSDFKIYASQAVVKEASQKDAEIASQRLEILCDFSLLDLNQFVLDLAEQFLQRSNFPAKLSASPNCVVKSSDRMSQIPPFLTLMLVRGIV